MPLSPEVQEAIDNGYFSYAEYVKNLETIQAQLEYIAELEDIIANPP